MKRWWTTGDGSARRTCIPCPPRIEWSPGSAAVVAAAAGRRSAAAAAVAAAG